MTAFVFALQGAAYRVGARQPGFQGSKWHIGMTTGAARGDLTGTC